ARRSAPGTAFARIEWRQLQDNVAAEQRCVGGRCLDPLNRTRRQMVKQVDDALHTELLEQPGDLRPNALQGFHLGEQRVEDFGPHEPCCHCERSEAIQVARGLPSPLRGLAMTIFPSYMAAMPSDLDLKRLAWRAHHRGTREADMLVGGFFDAHYQQ